MQAGGKRRRDARDLRREHPGGAQSGKSPGELLPAAIHQARIDLMVYEAVDFENTACEDLPVPPDPFLKFLHPILPQNGRCASHSTTLGPRKRRISPRLMRLYPCVRIYRWLKSPG